MIEKKCFFFSIVGLTIVVKIIETMSEEILIIEFIEISIKIVKSWRLERD